MMKRKSPIRHKVKAHTRMGKCIKAFYRGKGIQSLKINIVKSKVVRTFFKKPICVGIVGYSARKFDKKKALGFLREAFDELRRKHGKNVMIVSGLTDLGIPALAYREAVKRGWKTSGIACVKAEKYDIFDVDEKIIVGKEWGDESQTFIDSIDQLIRIGGGKQSLKETKIAASQGLPTREYELEELK